MDLSDLKRKHYPRQHPYYNINPLLPEDTTTPLLIPHFVMKTKFKKGNKYASKEVKSEAQARRA